MRAHFPGVGSDTVNSETAAAVRLFADADAARVNRVNKANKYNKRQKGAAGRVRALGSNAPNAPKRSLPA